MIKETSQETEQPEIKPVTTCLLLEISERTTTALLIKNVIGYSRLVSRAHVPSTHKQPENNALTGVFAAIRKLEKLSNQTLFNSEGDLILHTRQPGRGVDKFLISVSVGGLLKTMVVAPSINDPAVESAVHLLQRFPSKLERVLTGNGNVDPIENAAWMVENKPDFVFVVGSDANNRTIRSQIVQAAETIGIGIRQFSDANRPDVLYAASGHWVDAVETALNLGKPLKTAPNLRPDARHEHVKPARKLIEDLMSKNLLAGIPGLPELMRWFGEMPFSRNEGLAIFGRYQAALANGPVLIMDLDSNGLTMVFAKPKFTDLIVRPDLGIGTNLSDVESIIDIEQLAQWLPYDMGSAEARDSLRTHLINRSLFPSVIPQTANEFELDLVMLQGLIRQGVIDALSAWGLEEDQPLTLSRLFVRGDLLKMTGNHENLVRVLFNALQLQGECELYTDTHNAMALLGQLLEVEPTIAVDVIESDALQCLGWLVGVSGRGRRDREAVGIEIIPVNNQQNSKQSAHKILWGKTNYVSLSNSSGVHHALLRTKRRLGFASTTKIENIEGLTARVWVDARGRPIILPDDRSAQWEQSSSKA
ncbi:MAG: glutamate mutase L [Chloroflexota bacterium]